VREIFVSDNLCKGCVSKKENPISYFNLSTLFGKYSVLVPRSASKVSR